MSTAATPEKYLRVAEVARELRVSLPTVYRAVAGKRVRAVRLRDEGSDPDSALGTCAADERGGEVVTKSVLEEGLSVAVDAAKLAAAKAKTATKAADAAKREAARLEPRGGIISDLARAERSALLRIGPRRNRWRELERLQTALAENDARQAEARTRLSEVQHEREREPERHAAALAEWMGSGSKSDRPVSRLEALDREIVELQAEIEAQDVVRDRLLGERVEHVRRNRKRMTQDIAAEKERAAAQYVSAVEEAERARQDLLDLRATEVWALAFPHESLASNPDTGPSPARRRPSRRATFPASRRCFPRGASSGSSAKTRASARRSRHSPRARRSRA